MLSVVLLGITIQSTNSKSDGYPTRQVRVRGEYFNPQVQPAPTWFFAGVGVGFYFTRGWPAPNPKFGLLIILRNND
jgi:hypothetical protein